MRFLAAFVLVLFQWTALAAFDAHKNFAVSTVATAPSPATSGTSLVVASGQGSRFPAAPFNVAIWPAGQNPTPSNTEIARVTAISTDTLTITRAQEGTAARTVVVGDIIAATATAKTFTDLENATVTINGNSLGLNGSLTLSLASSSFANQGTTTTLLHGNASGNPSWSKVDLVNDVTGALANTSLANYTITVNGVAVPLGGSVDTCIEAPVGAQYLTLTTDSTLVNERVITAGSGISFTDNGAGSTFVVGLNSSYAPTWSGLTLTGPMIEQGVISPTTISSDQNDYNPTGLSTATTVRLTVDGSNRNITGLQTDGTDGREINLVVISGGGRITLVNNSGSSASTNVFQMGGNIDLKLGHSMRFRYDATSSCWRPMNRPLINLGTASGITGTLDAAQFPALTGDVTTSAGSLATTLATVTIAKGGTGQTTKTEAYDALSPTTTAGDIAYHNGTDNVRLAIGARGSPLASDGSAPTYFNPRKMYTLFDEHFNAVTGGPINWSLGNYNSGVNPGFLASESAAIGILEFSTGTTTNGGSTMRTGQGTSFVLGALDVDLTMRFKVPTLSDATDTFTLIVGLSDASTTAAGQAVDGAYFVYSSSGTYYANVGKWSGITASNSSRTEVTSSVTVVAGTWYMLRLRVNSAGNNVDFYVNDTLIGSSSTNIGTGTSRATGLTYKLEKQAGTTARTALIDMTWLTMEYASQR